MTRCTVCHHPIAHELLTCPICGEPARGTSLALARPTPAAKSEVKCPPHTSGLLEDGADATDTSQTAPRPRRSPRAKLLTVVPLFALVVAGTYLLLHDSAPGSPDRASYSLVRLASAPGVRWQVPVADIAPDFECQTPTSPNPVQSLDTCTVVDSVVLSDMVVVVVQRGDRATLAGLARKDGSVQWRRAGTAGFRYDCISIEGKLQCLSTPAPPYVLLSPQGTDRGLPDRTAAVSSTGALGGAVLSQVAPRTGVLTRSQPVPGSLSSVQFGGVGDHGFYVIAESSSTRLAALRYSEQGDLQWNRPLLLLGGAGPAVGSGLTPPLRVTERGGRSYVSAAQVGDRQAIFETSTGALAPVGRGHVAAVIGTAVVTQERSAGLITSGTGIHDNLVAGLLANDHSKGEPLITAYDAATNDLPYPQGPYSIRSVEKPGVVVGKLKIGETPIAFCAGVVVGRTLSSMSGFDGRTGKRLWSGTFTEGPGLQVRCDGSKVLISNGIRVTAYQTSSGDDSWSIVLPAGAQLTGGGYGDPAQGLIAGPGDLDPGTDGPPVTLLG